MADIDVLYAITQNVKNMALRSQGGNSDLVTAKLAEARAACEAAIAP